MKLVERALCESADLWFETKVESSTTPGTFYVVLVPSPDSEEDELICECLGFIHQGHCKHQGEVADNICRWEELTGPEEQQEIGICPRCGGSTVTSLEIE